MANVAHSTLTGADLHESKGVSTAAPNTIYVADGVGSGAWSSGGVLLGITGMIADFALPVAPTGWLECNGGSASRVTFANLFAAVTIQQTGTRTNASPIITGLTDTSNMRAGYAVGGTGITNGFTVLTVDSATQITMSGNATSSGSGTVIVSPWGLGDGTTTFTLPEANINGRFRRSRGGLTASRIGLVQADALLSHTHTGTSSATTSSGASATHTHTVGGTTGSGSSHSHGTTESPHTHALDSSVFVDGANNYLAVSGGGITTRNLSQTTSFNATQGNVTGLSINAEAAHTHGFSATSSNASADHSHNTTTTITTSSQSPSGLAENRPISLVVLTCIKT